jgi:hypothetical protein
MSTPEDDLQEFHEHAERAHADPSLLPVSFSMSVLAVLVAVVTLMAHRAHTHTVVAQIRAADTWSEYQAVNTRRHSYDIFSDFIDLSTPKEKEHAQKLRDQFRQQAAHYEEERKNFRSQAEELEGEVRHEEHRADRFDFGEALLEVALVITSITLLTRRRAFWYLGLCAAGLGIAVALSGLVVQ